MTATHCHSEVSLAAVREHPGLKANRYSTDQRQKADACTMHVLQQRATQLQG